jgi:hypothetical protein
MSKVKREWVGFVYRVPGRADLLCPWRNILSPSLVYDVSYSRRPQSQYSLMWASHIWYKKCHILYLDCKWPLWMQLVELNVFSPFCKDQTPGWLQRDNSLDRSRLQLQLNNICAVTTLCIPGHTMVSCWGNHTPGGWSPLHKEEQWPVGSYLPEYSAKAYSYLWWQRT